LTAEILARRKREFDFVLNCLTLDFYGTEVGKLYDMLLSCRGGKDVEGFELRLVEKVKLRDRRNEKEETSD